MLSVMKNALVTGASKEDVSIRKRELDWFSRNCWIIASQATVIAGFAFSQLSRPGNPEGAGWSYLLQVTLTGIAFVCALNVLVRATLSGIYAQASKQALLRSGSSDSGLALRGHEGFSDLAVAIRRLRNDQDRILRQFITCLVCFVLSSFAAVCETGRQGRASVKVEAALLFVSLALAAVAWRSISLFYHAAYG
ncbi:uncharacterized protein LOC34621139 [Cyclospora cayetanensis]|uniref:Uncharacterized protein LOC34621139 n=1 Tax=Cyclospora cayetanensis TaxID=88456 RepID=A0A6P6RUD7_9EIME|nr:uncharacterized protein LOC34621139 [Cyclospora cayetanensis]